MRIPSPINNLHWIWRFKYSPLLLGVLLSTGSALAVDLQNDDNKNYEVKIIEGNSVIQLSIKPNSTEKSVCQSICSIELQGEIVGAVGDTTVTIKQGKLHGQSQMCPKQVCTAQGCQTEYYTASSCPLQPKVESPRQRRRKSAPETSQPPTPSPLTPNPLTPNPLTPNPLTPRPWPYTPLPVPPDTAPDKSVR
ncbi:MAG: hypothetical protein K6T90_06795 [Leptolyngbyaceae cyanobacterium HOT.MB2.61]|nr:hypothetical protein [Leptolyngbyaceae cyanobacterium HOT.MB2.61]